MRTTLLLCDDDPMLVDLVQYRLAARGWEVIVACDGGEALARLAEAVPDAIVLDAMMPVVDGDEVLRRLRQNPARAATPVVMLTARKQETDVLRALELGASDYMAKPFIPEELVARLARLTEAQAT